MLFATLLFLGSAAAAPTLATEKREVSEHMLGRTPLTGKGGSIDGELTRFTITNSNEWCLGPEGDWNGAKIVLLPCTDDKTLHIVEGPQHRFPKAGDKCLDVAGGTAVNGDRPQVWDCDSNNKNQHWQHVGSGDYTYLWMPAVSTTKCLDIKDGTREPNTPIQFWDCYADSSNQRWGIMGP